MFDAEYLKQFQKKKKLSQFSYIGCDEVGRGPLAGPVVAAAVGLEIINYSEKECMEFINFLTHIGIRDSKKLSSESRQSILKNLSIGTLCAHQKSEIKVSKNIILKFSIQEISARSIDEINILQASLLAMKMAVTAINNQKKEGLVLIDGNRSFLGGPKNLELETLIKGDSKSIIIGLASIIAKEYRDQLMIRFSHNFPEYGWEKNSGYPTKQHLKMIEEKGLTPIHRLTFRGVKEVYEQRGVERS